MNVIRATDGYVSMPCARQEHQDCTSFCYALEVDDLIPCGCECHQEHRPTQAEIDAYLAEHPQEAE